MVVYYVLAAVTAVLFSGALVGAKVWAAKREEVLANGENEKLNKILSWISFDNVAKVLGVLLAAAFYIRYMSGKVVIRETIGLNIYSPFPDKRDLLSPFIAMLLLWFTYAAVIATMTYPFFKKKVRSLTPIVKLFVPIVYVLDLAFLSTTLIAMDGQEAVKEITSRGIFYGLEIGLALACVVGAWLERPKFSLSVKRSLVTVAILLLMIVISMPAYTIQVIYGYDKTGIIFDDFTFHHRLILYGAIFMPVVIAFLFGRFDYERKRYAIFYIALATMTTYLAGYSFESLKDPTSWPLHLCNTAMFIIPLCLGFKMKRLFYFTLFINVLGAFLAMILPNYGDANSFSASVIGFWVNHYFAFFMPILCIALNLFGRPKMKQFLYSLIAFFGYYVLVLICNAWFSNYGEVDFFFINSDFIADKLGKWAEDLRNFTWTLEINGLTMTWYPIYQSLYFLVYVALSFAMWFLYELAFHEADLYQEIVARNRVMKADRLALEVKLAGRSVSEPMNTEGQNKLILRNFSKKYSTSDVYAVKDACLEIEGGQIFGFLGPNGAGKSTIIKSIVGIQSITSGSIEVCGYDVEKQSVGAKLQTGFVPDHYALYENLTGREYVNYIADLYGVSEADRTARIEEYVGRFNLAHSFDNPIKTYSHGMKQKITIMSALVHNPKLWILDEPLTGLDPESIFQVKEAMKKHAAEGNIVFFSSHIIDVVERICDRIAIIKKGTIMCERSVKELEEEGIQLEKFYMETIGDMRHD